MGKWALIEWDPNPGGWKVRITATREDGQIKNKNKKLEKIRKWARPVWDLFLQVCRTPKVGTYVVWYPLLELPVYLAHR